MQLTRGWNRAYILFYSKVSFDIDGLFLTFLWDDDNNNEDDDVGGANHG